MLKKEFFSLLRYSVGSSEETVPIGIEVEDWNDFYLLAQQQSLLGILFYGIERSGGALRPPRSLLLKWYAVSEQIRRENVRANRVAVKVSESFRKVGFRSCILKGQGNALNYPDPYIRMSGDVDIWLDGGRKKIMQFVNSQWRGLTVRYHHVEIPDVDGVPVEVHFMPSLMHAPWLNRRWQGWSALHAEEQFCNKVSLPGGAGEVCVPTLEFNLVYQLQHMFRHVFSEGIGLRQMMDYFFLLQKAKDGLEYRDESLECTLRHLGLYKFAGAVMWVLHEVLGLKEGLMLVPADEEEGRFLLDEILIGGNFGKYDTRLGSKEGEGTIRRYFRMTFRNLRIATHYPAEALCEPLFRTWFFFWRMTH